MSEVYHGLSGAQLRALHHAFLVVDEQIGTARQHIATRKGGTGLRALDHKGLVQRFIKCAHKSHYFVEHTLWHF